MPVIRPSGRGKALLSLKTHLADLLFKELMGHALREGPVIFEDPVAPRKIDVIVIWEAWDGLSQDDRTAVIREAYSRYSRTLEDGVHFPDPANESADPIVPRVMLTIGATWKESVELNLLPHAIYPSFDPAQVSPDEVETILFDSGAIESPAGVQPRFPSESLAREVQARLIEEMPEVQWSLVNEVVPVDGWSGR